VSKSHVLHVRVLIISIWWALQSWKYY